MISQNTNHNTLGAILSGLSALFYSSAAICIRQMADYDVDRAFLIAGKETVTVIALLPWIVWAVWCRPEIFRQTRLIVIVAMVAVVVQLGGNLNQIFAFKAAGLTIAVPLQMAMLLMASAGLGWAVLGERIPMQTIFAMTVLILSIVLISYAGHQSHRTELAEQAESSQALDANPDAVSDNGSNVITAKIPMKLTGSKPIGLLIAGIGAAMLCGTIFGSLSLTIRYATTSGLSIRLLMFITCVVGTISLGTLGGTRTGLSQLAEFPADLWFWIIVSGVFNFLGFICITSGLSMTNIVRANLLGASQVAVTAFAGILLFSEPTSVLLWLGIGLTIAGIAMINSGGSAADEESMP